MLPVVDKNLCIIYECILYVLKESLNIEHERKLPRPSHSLRPHITSGREMREPEKRLHGASILYTNLIQ